MTRYLCCGQLAAAIWSQTLPGWFRPGFNKYTPLQGYNFASVSINFHHDYHINTTKIIILTTVIVKIFIGTVEIAIWLICSKSALDRAGGGNNSCWGDAIRRPIFLPGTSLKVMIITWVRHHHDLTQRGGQTHAPEDEPLQVHGSLLAKTSNTSNLRVFHKSCYELWCSMISSHLVHHCQGEV